MFVHKPTSNGNRDDKIASQYVLYLIKIVAAAKPIILINKKSDSETAPENFPSNGVWASVHKFCHSINTNENKTTIPENKGPVQVVYGRYISKKITDGK